MPATLHLVRDGTAVHLSWDGVAYALAEEREGARPRAGTTRVPSRPRCRAGWLRSGSSPASAS